MNRKPLHGIESLESRRCLTVLVEVSNGDLIVSGQADGLVDIAAVEQGVFRVTDNGVVIPAVDEHGNSVDTFSGVDDDIRIRLDIDGTETNDDVTVDLKEHHVDRILVDLGSGDNRFMLERGIVAGSLFYRGVGGDDTVGIGAEASVEGNVIARMGGGANTVNVEGDVGRNLMVRAGAGDDIVEIGEDARIERSVRAALGGGDNTVEHAGEVGRSLAVRAGDGDDTVRILAEAVVGRRMRLALGNGDNETTHEGTLDGSMWYRGGSGNDRVELTESATVEGDVRLRLGQGDNAAIHRGQIEGNLHVTSANSADDARIDITTGAVNGETELTPGEETNQARPRFGRRFGGSQRPTARLGRFGGRPG